ncbi:MAG TPA: autotransporter-associated beta strand repeat-containing protein [bacterium]|nr:autotransporter-associated beta strand repeat-containing protein [bacterium]
MNVHAVNVTKLDTTTMNGGVLDWSAAPAAGDIGEFGATPSATTLANMTLGGNLTLGGLQLDGTMNGPLTIASGATLTLGTASGINMSAANNDCTLNCGLTVNLAQTWNVTSGRTLTIVGAITTFPSGKVLTVTGGGTVNAVGINTGNGTGGVLITMAGGTFSGTDINIQKTAATTTTIPTATSPVSAPTSAGFYVNGAGATVNLGQLEISTGNGASSGRIDTGSVTVTNTMTIGKSTSGSTSATGRGAYFQVNGGTFTALDTVNGIVMSPNATAGNQNLSEFYISGGTATVGKVSFGASTDANAGIGFFLIKGGNCYMGSGGFVRATTIGTYAATVSLFSGLLGAAADWSTSMPIAMSGSSGTPFTIQAADAASVAHNISLSGIVSGPGALTKTGNGTLTLGAANTYSGSTVVNEGTLALDVNGSISSVSITVASNAIYDVSLASAGGNILGSGKTIKGVGTVVGLTAGAGSHISPADGSTQGTLKFTGGLTATDANFDMELTDDPTGTVKTNDFISITGDLNVSGGTSLITVTPVGSLGVGTYTLMHFTGSLIGDISNLSCASGTLTNPPGSGDIKLIVAYVRPAGDLAWRGDGGANLWDTTGSSNWLNGANYDYFYTGDTVTFDDTATNFLVNLSGIVTPASTGVVLVNATNDYTLADAGGAVIHGPTGLTKTNTGVLTVATLANDYTGATTVNGGTLSIANVANGGSVSPIGAASSSPANLVLNGGILEYTGNNLSTDRGITLGANGATISVTNATKTLTLSGTLTGPGSLTKTGNGQITLTGANDYQGGTVVTWGTIRANPAGTLSTNALTLNGTTNPATFLFAGDSQTLNNTLNVVGTNNYLAGNGNDTVKAITGNGTLYLNNSSAGVLITMSGSLSDFSGTLAWNTLTTNRLDGLSVYYGTNATFDLGTGIGTLMNRDGNMTVHIGALLGGPSTVLMGAFNSDNANPTVYVIGAKGLNTLFEGKIQDRASQRKAALVKTGAGTLTLTQPSPYTSFTTVSNGVLALAYNGSTDGTLTGTTNIYIVAGATLDVSGRSDGTLNLGGSQTLRGSGLILGAVNTSGLVSPGSGVSGSLGTLTVTNSINLSGTTWIKLNRASSPNSDRLASSTAGVINYGGTLIVTNTGGALQAGDTFTLFSGATLNNSTFGDVQLPNYYSWDTSNLGVNGTVQVTAVLPPPALTNVDFSTLGSGTITLNAINGAPNGPVIVQTTTNLLSNWTSISTNAFDGSGNFSLPVTVDPAAPQNYFRLLAN